MSYIVIAGGEESNRYVVQCEEIYIGINKLIVKIMADSGDEEYLKKFTFYCFPITKKDEVISTNAKNYVFVTYPQFREAWAEKKRWNERLTWSDHKPPDPWRWHKWTLKGIVFLMILVITLIELDRKF